MKMKSVISLFLSLVLLVSSALPAAAQENAFKEIFEDALYGGLAGTLIGAATLAFTKKPADHLRNLGIGAGVGVIAGTAYGLVKTTKALAQVENGKVRFAVPTVMPELREQNYRGDVAVVLNAELIRGNF